MLQGLFPSGAHPNPALDMYLSNFNFGGALPANFGEKLKSCRTIIDRLTHDQVDVNGYSLGAPHTQARACIIQAATAYWQYLNDTNRMDYSRLENLFHDRLAAGRLNRFTVEIQAVLVDEYQDTNPLQESIYFELIRRTHASFTIVGDDDQSLYRFRGATVELFRDFVARFTALVPGLPGPHIEYLVENYRSTPEVVTFFNNFIQFDPGFTAARVQPPKPLIMSQLASNGIPVLGMFRPDAATLANDLVSFLWDVFRGPGRNITVNGQPVTIIRDPDGGDFGDCVFLSHTANEYAARFGNNPPRERLPKLMRDRLFQRQVAVFNPRGRALRDIPVVQQLLGTILECIDPPTAADTSGVQQAAVNAQLRADARRYLTFWRQAARAFIASNPLPNQPQRLEDFVAAWQARVPQGPPAWPTDWPLLELCFKLLTWMPALHNDPEGQVYLEAITRCLSQAATFSSYRSTIYFGQPPHDVNSIRRAIVDIMAPLAEGDVEIDEDIMPHIPRSRLPFMTIHQAKGLEYPLVIVDISSDYRGDHPYTRFRRFPDTPSNVQVLENDLAPYCGIGPLRTARAAMSRTFDDLTRLYYVAYSRPQSALLLVGLDVCLRYSTPVRHVATSWASNGTWAWRTPVGGRTPGLANNIPLHLI
jgi:DNA helicase-2/ATP-dependent DNA helicase PcrA